MRVFKKEAGKKRQLINSIRRVWKDEKQVFRWSGLGLRYPVRYGDLECMHIRDLFVILDLISGKEAKRYLS